MSIEQTEAQLRVIANSVGIPDERSDDIKALGDAADVELTADLEAVVNAIGYYDEKAAHLEAAGLTMVVVP